MRTAPVTHTTPQLITLQAYSDLFVIAGGAARFMATGEPFEDIDLFVINPGVNIDDVISTLETDYSMQSTSRPGLWHGHPVYDASDWYAAVPTQSRVPVQLIDARTAGSIEGLLGDFGFTVEQFVVSGTTVLMGVFSWWDVKNKRLRLVHSGGHALRQEGFRNPSRTISRVAKYGKKGYTFDRSEAIKLLDYYAGLKERDQDKIRASEDWYEIGD